MAEGKKIKYEDLFDPKLDDQVKQLEATFKSLKDSLKEFAAVAGKEIKMTGMKTPEDMQKLAKAIGDVEQAEKALKVVTDEEIKAQLAAKQAQKERTDALKAQVKAEQAAEGSVAQLRAKLSQVTMEWAKLSKEERENTKAGQSVVASKKQLTEELKKLEAATGDHRRNVGNYTEALKGIPGPMGSVIDSTINLGKQLWALAMNPIVATVALITGALYGLFKAFTSTDEGGKKFEKMMNMLSATIDVVRQRAAQFADGLIDFFSGNWDEAAKKMGDSFKGIGDQINAATEAAGKYTEALDAIEDKETDYISQRAKNAKQIAELEFIASDPSQQKAKRIKALEDAISLGQKELEFNKQQAIDKYNIELNLAAAKYNVNRDLLQQYIEADQITAAEILRNNKSIAEARNNMNNEGQASLEGYYGAVQQAEKDYFERFKGDNKKLEKLREDISKADEERRKKKEEADKKAAEDEKKRQADLLAFYNKSIDEQIFALETQRMDKKNKNELMYVDQIEFENKLYAWRIQKAGLSYDELERLRVEHEANLKEIQDQGGDGGEAFKLLLKEREDYLKAQKDQLEQQREDIKKASEDILKAVEDGLKERAKLQQDADQKAIDNQKKMVERQAKLAAEGKENALAAEEAALARAERKKLDDAKKAQKQQEALELAKVFLNLVAEYSKDNPNNATAKALAMTLIAKGISKSIAGAFATGVEGLDGEGTETSDSNVALLSKGESVITARGTKSNPGLATAMNTGTVDEYFKSVYMPQFASSNHLDIPKAEQVNNALFKVLNNKLESLESAIRDKPVSMTKLNGLGEWTEEVQQANMRIITHHRKGGNRF